MTFKKGLTRIINSTFVAMKNNMSYICMAFGLLAAFTVLLSWLYGYWSNGLWGTHFEINSCWQGLGGIVAGLGGVAALAGTQYAKYYLDSKYNSAEGKSPEGGK